MQKEYHMIREIREQPEIIKKLLNKYVEGNHIAFDFLSEQIDFSLVKRVVFLGCGTSYYAGFLGSLLIEECVDIVSGVEYADEFNVRNSTIDDSTLVVLISQSGKTTDVVRAAEKAHQLGAQTLAITNGIDSDLAKICTAVIYTEAGTEQALAATKSFTSQLLIVYLLSFYLGEKLNPEFQQDWSSIVHDFTTLPELITKTLSLEGQIARLTKDFSQYDDFVFLGKKYNYPIALEGAHKMKETTYIHAEGSASEEFIHGPNAIIDQNFPCVFIAPIDSVYEENMAVYEKIKKAGATNIVLTTESNTDFSGDDILFLPTISEILSPLLYVTPLQMLAYYIAVERGIDVDVLRNITKFVAK